jgi:glycosyltransferase involved in cell wall biosynthesis
MNILVFTTAFYPSVGGLENQTFYLVEEFVKLGHNVKIIVYQTPSHYKPEFEKKAEKVDVYYNPGFFKVFVLFAWCNVCYMPNFSLKGWWFIVFKPFKKWIISHNDIYLLNKKSAKIKVKLLLIKFASHNISVSNYIANYINTRSKIIYNCYDDEIFKIYTDEGRKYDFVFLGRLVSQKGCEMLIKACKNINTDFTLNIIGDGPERPKLEAMVKSLALEKNIHFLGVLKGVQLARILNRHKTLIIPSLDKEGFGIVALEGLACGCRVIASNAGGLCEAVNGFGRLFEMGNQAELESLLVEELEKSNDDTPLSKGPELETYLSAQCKKTIANKYLQFFK